jgi:hypothetical protein
VAAPGQQQPAGAALPPFGPSSSAGAGGAIGSSQGAGKLGKEPMAAPSKLSAAAAGELEEPRPPQGAAAAPAAAAAAAAPAPVPEPGRRAPPPAAAEPPPPAAPPPPLPLPTDLQGLADYLAVAKAGSEIDLRGRTLSGPLASSVLYVLSPVTLRDCTLELPPGACIQAGAVVG